MRWRTRISAAVWLNLRDVHAAEDIFQNVVLKAMTRDVVFDTESALLSWALYPPSEKQSIGFVETVLKSDSCQSLPWSRFTMAGCSTTSLKQARGPMRFNLA